MAEKVSSSPVVADDTSSNESKTGNEVVVDSVTSEDGTPSASGQIAVPLKWKLASIIMVSAIGFGSNWSSGITGAMKTTIKKQMKINNTQYALLDASEDFMKTVLILASGMVTDKIGGAGKKTLFKLTLHLNTVLTKDIGAILYGNLIFTVGSIIVAASAQTLTYEAMVFGRVVQALGDISTQVAQYKIFSSVCKFPLCSPFLNSILGGPEQILFFIADPGSWANEKNIR